MKRIFVAEIVASTGSFIEQFQVGEVERRLKKDGQAYLSLTLKDRTGEIDGKLWDIPAGLTIAEGEFVKVEAETGTYRDEVQLNIRRIRKLVREEVQLEDFLPISKRDRNEMLSELRAALGTIGDGHPGLREALLRMGEELAPALMNAPQPSRIIMLTLAVCSSTCSRSLGLQSESAPITRSWTAICWSQRPFCMTSAR